MVAQLGGRTDSQQPPLADQADHGAEVLDLGDLVGGEKDGHALQRGDLEELVVEIGGRSRVEAGRRFVQEQQIRAGKQRLGNGQLALHAPAPGADRLVASLPETHGAQQIADAFASVFGAHVLDAAEVVEILLGGQPIVEIVLLQQCAGAAADLVGVGAHVEAQDAGLARGRLKQAEQQMDQRRLARTVGAEQPEDNARRHGQRDIVHARARRRTRR